MPVRPALILLVTEAFLVIHIASTFSSLGRIILGTSAMSHERILPKVDEEDLTPNQLNDVLVYETLLSRQADISIRHQYRMDYHETIRSHKYDGKWAWCRKRKTYTPTDSAVSSMEQGRAQRVGKGL